MGKENVNKFLGKLKKRKVLNLLIIVVLILIMLVIIMSYFKDLNNITESEKVNVQEEKENSNIEKETSEETYEEQTKSELKNILSKIQGVGEVEVMLYFEGSEEKVPAIDSSTQKSTTEEADNDGGKRVNNQETDGEKVVITSNNKGNEPLILKTKKPKITGVVIVAEGAENSKIKYEVTKAISNLYDISNDRVNVFSMKK